MGFAAGAGVNDQGHALQLCGMHRQRPGVTLHTAHVPALHVCGASARLPPFDLICATLSYFRRGIGEALMRLLGFERQGLARQVTWVNAHRWVLFIYSMMLGPY